MKPLSLIFAILLAVSSKSSHAQDKWAQKADFGGMAREDAVGFSIGNKGYVGTGSDGSVYKNDFWEYDPVTNEWTQKASMDDARTAALGFSINGKGYVGMGQFADFSSANDFWEYDPSTNVWTRKSNFGGAARENPTGFSIGNKGYVGTGYDGSFYNDFWEYDPTTDTWTRKTDFGGSARTGAVGFTIGSKGYIGTGRGPTGWTRDFWEYDPATDTWTQKADFGGTARQHATGFSIVDKGYIGTGQIDFSGASKNDFWEYDPVSDSWGQKTDFGGTARLAAVGFSIGSKGYLGTGLSIVEGNRYYDDFWEYTPEEPFCATPYGGYTTNITSISVTLAWNDSTTDATGYRIYYKVKNTSGWIKTHAKGTPHSKTLKGLSPNNTYVWQVAAKCNANLHSDFSQHFEFTTLSGKENDITNLSDFDLSISPNPFNGNVTIQATLQYEESLTIKILDLAGKELYSEKLGKVQGKFSRQLDLGNFSNGTYFLQLIHDGKIEVKKLILLQ